jgi:hypothetical protein
MKKMDLNSKDPLLDKNLDPSANNTNTALSAFYQKKLYELKAFNHPYLTQNKPINFLYEKQYYGRVNLSHEPVMSDSVRLKTITNGRGIETTLHNFVMDAYKDFLSYWDFLKKSNRTAAGGLLQTVNAKIGYLDPGKKYFYYMEAIFDKIKEQINAKKVKIKNLDDFINEFVEYVDGVTPSLPITFSSYIGSRMADPLISGLCFDVNSLDPSDDGKKYSIFLQDQNYALFKKTAMKFGFFIDKQIPWRLWADIDSPAMKPYMDKYTLTQDNLYDLNYITADSYDLELLRFYIIQFYNTHAFSNSVIIEPQFSICQSSGATIIKYKNTNVEQIEHKKIASNSEFDRLFMKLYVFAKARENNYNWDKSHFENVVATFIQIKEGLDTKSAMKYITPLMKLPAVADRVQRNFKFH